jgi:hypothetical protein
MGCYNDPWDSTSVSGIAHGMVLEGSWEFFQCTWYLCKLIVALHNIPMVLFHWPMVYRKCDMLSTMVLRLVQAYALKERCCDLTSA